MLKVIILDFDGVILESVDIKTRAFRELFKDYPEHVDAIVEYHLKHGGVSRYKKFSYIYGNILKQPLTDEKLAELGKRFSQLVVDEVKKCAFVPGALEFLAKYSKKLKLFVASGTPEDELRIIADERGLSKYFMGLYGAPATKSEIIERIMTHEKLGRNRIVYVGDSTTDYEEAKKAGVQFIALVSNSASFNPFLKFNIKTVRDFYELDEMVSRLL